MSIYKYEECDIAGGVGYDLVESLRLKLPDQNQHLAPRARFRCKTAVDAIPLGRAQVHSTMLQKEEAASSGVNSPLSTNSIAFGNSLQ